MDKEEVIIDNTMQNHNKILKNVVADAVGLEKITTFFMMLEDNKKGVTCSLAGSLVDLLLTFQRLMLRSSEFSSLIRALMLSLEDWDWDVVEECNRASYEGNEREVQKAMKKVDKMLENIGDSWQIKIEELMEKLDKS